MVDTAPVNEPTQGPDESVVVDFYVAQDGLKGRQPGIYLDAQERVAAERRRAVVEGREKPEFNLAEVASTAGTPLVVKDQLAVTTLDGNHNSENNDEADPLTSADVPVEVPATAPDVTADAPAADASPSEPATDAPNNGTTDVPSFTV